MPEQTFPTPLHSQTYDTGPLYLKYLKHPKAWEEVTVISEFEDGGRDFLEHAANAPQRWSLTYNGLEDDDANILDEFYASHRRTVSFTFIEPRNHPWTYTEGDTYTGCYFEDFKKNHADVNGAKYIHSRDIVIVKYPA